MRRVFFYAYNMAEKTTTQKAKLPGATPSRGTLQSYIQNFTLEAIDCLVDIMHNSRNESLKMGAAKTLIDKSIPDIKAVEITGENGGPIKLNIISGADYVSALGASTATSTGSTPYGPAEIQSTDLAQASPQDNDSNQSVSKVDTA
jgi:hypothetical protein